MVELKSDEISKNEQNMKDIKKRKYSDYINGENNLGSN